MRHDLADKYAFIFALPNRNDYRSDAIDNTDYADTLTAPFYNNAEDFGNQMHEIVRRASVEYLSDDEHYIVYKQPYEIGPPAQTWPMFLNLLQQLGPVADIMGISAFSFGVIAGMARFIRRVHRRFLLSRGVSEYSLPKVIYTKPVLAAMCEDHIRSNFHPTAALTIDAFSVDDPTLFASENHPGLREIYIVDCRAGRKTYTFHLDCHGGVQSFVLRQGQRTEVLPNPDLFEVDSGDEGR